MNHPQKIKDILDAPNVWEAQMAFEKVTLFACVRQRDLRISYISPLLKRELGVRKKRLVGISFFDFLLGGNQKIFCFKGGKAVLQDVPIQTKNGLNYFNINVVRISGGWLVLGFSPILPDGLTGLASKGTFIRTASSFFRAMKRVNGQGVLILLDIDNFKKINDTHGHPEGDKALVDVAVALKKTFQRSADVVGRLGGDEFGVFSVEGPTTGEKLSKNIGRLIDEELRVCLNETRKGKFPVELSPGWDFFGPEHPCDSFDALYESADKVLYITKSIKKKSSVSR